ncbi:MAG: hypothetical protein RDV41_02575 [Planctomycetota bacterium]|nr:hypothetical protein [Planctomycetota bacterium]
MKQLFWVAMLALVFLAAVIGCSRAPQSHRGIRVDVTNYNQAVDITANVLQTYFDIDAVDRAVPVSTIHSKPKEFREMERVERRTAIATITKIEERVAEIEVAVWYQRDMSNTGYDTGSAANRAWGERTADSTLERKILLDIQAAFNQIK